NPPPRAGEGARRPRQPLPPLAGGGWEGAPRSRMTGTRQPAPTQPSPPPSGGGKQDAVSTPPLHPGKGARSVACTRPTLPEPGCAVAGGPAQRTQGGAVRGAGPPAAARSIAAPQPSTAANAHREHTSADHEPPARSRTRSKSASGANAPYTPAPAPPSRLRQNAPASGLPADNSTAACSCTANAATSDRACACSIDAPSAPRNRASPAS